MKKKSTKCKVTTTAVRVYKVAKYPAASNPLALAVATTVDAIRFRLHLLGTMKELNQAALELNMREIRKAWRLAHPAKRPAKPRQATQHKRSMRLRRLNRDRTRLLTYVAAFSGECAFLASLLAGELATLKHAVPTTKKKGKK